MKKCLLIKNSSGGNVKKATKDKRLFDKLNSVYDVVEETQINAEAGRFDILKACTGFDALCISGGDGTLNSAINAIRGLDIDLLYNPSGTVNDFAHTQVI